MAIELIVPPADPGGTSDVSEASGVERVTDRPDMPLPEDLKAVFLGGIFVMALLGGAYVAKEVVLPIVLAFVLKLLLQPVMRLLARLHIPRIVAAIVMILLLFSMVGGLGELLRNHK
jgi:predicted PurR-regulated permease PerM